MIGEGKEKDRRGEGKGLERLRKRIGEVREKDWRG